MSVVADYLGSTRFIPQLDSAVSNDAKEIRRIEAENVSSDASSSFGQIRSDVLRDLMNEFSQASRPDWDGYGALPAKPEALIYAIQFIQAISPSFPRPDISIDPDGEIALEWQSGPRRVFSVHIGRDGTMNYAGLDGFSVFHGIENLRENIPSPISEGIRRVTDPT